MESKNEELCDINIKELMNANYEEPSLSVYMCKIVRQSVEDNNKNPTEKNSKSSNLLGLKIQNIELDLPEGNNGLFFDSETYSCWKIQNEKLTIVPKENNGIFFDGESYIIQWAVDLEFNSRTVAAIIEHRLVYYWKGQKASKGFTPLPPELEEHCPVERIVQWSETPFFFHGFEKFIVFSGSETEFNAKLPHLFLIRGELLHEIHLYEVPCKRESLRSRATFLLVLPEEKQFLYWHGVSASTQYKKYVKERQFHNHLKQWETSWHNFETFHLKQGNELGTFLEVLSGNPLVPLNIKVQNFSPKLFYLNSISGQFAATEVQYPLRSKHCEAPFPFLQSHLYTAPQPALFLLDNNDEIWLWEGPKDDSTDLGEFQKELKLAKELQQLYSEEKQRTIEQPVSCIHVDAYQEPNKFKNIFPIGNSIDV